MLAARYRHGGLGRSLIYALLSVQFMRLARGPRDRLRIVLATVRLAIAEGLGRRAGPVRVPVVYEGHRHELLAGCCNDLDVLKSVLLDGAYPDLGLPGQPDVIVDLGSHMGASLLVFHARYPRAKLVGAEADPGVFALLRENVRALPEVVLCNAAVTGRDGVVKFYPWRDAWGSSVHPSDRAGDPIEVPARTLRSVLDEAAVTHVDLLKLNIEGAELDVIRSFDDWACVQALIVEWHGDYLSSVELEEAMSILREHFVVDVQAVDARPRDRVITARRSATIR
jgi:FkbM family methyltransferase